LNADDFVLREQGHPQQICNFVRADMPVDLLFLFDVSGSRQAHVKRIASAAHEALRGLGDNDRVAIMVFRTDHARTHAVPQQPAGDRPGVGQHDPPRTLSWWDRYNARFGRSRQLP
jgi:hypothetical protein